MPGWLIDWFGSRLLNDTFWLLTLAPLPAWCALVFFPNHRWTKRLASPFLAPPLLGLVYFYLVWKLTTLGSPTPGAATMRGVRGYLGHPVVFLVLWAHLQTANLFVGTVLLEDARRRRLSIPLELALCWLFAPAAVVFYAVRRIPRLLSSS